MNKKVFNLNDNWEVKIDTVDNCSKAPEKVDVLVSQLVKCKINTLMKEYKGKEWLAYLIGKDLIVEDIFIPQQEITSSTISNVVCPEYNTLSVIGVIHSHNDMGTEFSHTDNDWINQNHNISICISDSSINGQVRWKTPCGALKIIKANIKQKVDIDFDDKKFIKSVNNKIKEKTYNYHNQTNYYDAFTEKFKKDIDKEISELNFEAEKTLEEELLMIEEMNNLDDKETN